MFKYILKRLGYSILVLIGVSMLIYFLTRLMPINFVENKIAAISTNGPGPAKEKVEAMYEAYGLSPDASFGSIMKGYVNGC